MREQKITFEEAMPLILEKLQSGGEVLFSPSGVSMRPTLQEGRDSLVLVAPPAKLKKYDIALFKRENGQYILHRVVKVGESYTFIGDNQFDHEEGIMPAQIVALCSAYIRDGKRVSLDSFGARAFARFWHHTRLLRRICRKLRTLATPHTPDHQ